MFTNGHASETSVLTTTYDTYALIPMFPQDSERLGSILQESQHRTLKEGSEGVGEACKTLEEG